VILVLAAMFTFSDTLYAALTWRPTSSDSKWNGIGFVCSSDLKPQKISNRKRYCVGRP